MSKTEFVDLLLNAWCDSELSERTDCATATEREKEIYRAAFRHGARFAHQMHTLHEPK